MRWLLLLHIAAMLCWCGVLIYLPALISGIAAQRINLQGEQDHLPRMIFNLILTPMALVAIISGTLVFAIKQIITFWLVIKLTLVVGLVICHTFNGWLILKMEKGAGKRLNVLCFLCGIASLILITSIISLVLAKPRLGVIL
ncbi:hypothetical protein FOG18_12640 [Legionella israelensis]|uniref:CopD family protein n=1 Tax=Legionella israelensis TaxID=454 RepID=UPI00117CEA26|nr:CopD family protein [Legionella israelensis]QDP73350.1 hypothetical protein FOG18_12640 [Legionella israelensis]